MRTALSLLALCACSNLTQPPVETLMAEAGAAGSTTTGASAQPPTRAPTPPAPQPEVAGDPETELKIEDLKQGAGPAVKMGDTVQVHYAGTLRDGKQFDTNRGRDPLKVTVGQGVIDGFSKGLVGMKAGGKRKVTIPWKMAYGAEGRPPIIPPKATLIFELELDKIGN